MTFSSWLPWHTVTVMAEMDGILNMKKRAQKISFNLLSECHNHERQSKKAEDGTVIADINKDGQETAYLLVP